MHASLDLIKRDLDVPPVHALNLLRGLRSLGFRSWLRDDADGEGDDLVVPAWEDHWSSSGSIALKRRALNSFQLASPQEESVGTSRVQRQVRVIPLAPATAAINCFRLGGAANVMPRSKHTDTQPKSRYTTCDARGHCATGFDEGNDQCVQ
jgi:hypothetical protein